MKQFNIILEERELNNNFEPISRKTISNQHIKSSTEDDKTYEFAIKEITQCTLNSFIADKDKMPSVPIKSINDHDREIVKKVCEKIKNWGNKHFNWVGDGTGYDGQDYNEMIGFNNAIKQLNEFLDQIQKDV